MEAAAQAEEWGVSPEAAGQYLEFLQFNAYFATALMCPVSIGSASGIVVSTSTAASTRRQMMNLAEHQAGMGSSFPYWLELQVWWYPHLAFLNFHGLTDPTHQGQLLPVSFGDFLQDYCTRQGFPMPREPVFGGAVLAPLRRLLRRLGVPVWAEITVGSSYRT